MIASRTGEGRSVTTAARSIGLCCMVAFFEGIDLQAPGVVAPKLAAALHLAPPQLGWFFSIGTFGLLLGAAIGGRLADRMGRKKVLMLAVASFGCFTLATAAAGTYPVLLAMRGLTGLGLGAAFPNLLALCSENARPDGRRLAVAMMYAGLPLGGTLASLVALLAAAGGSWRVLFLIGGAAPIVAIPLLWRFLPDSAAFHMPAPIGRAARAGIGAALFGGGRAATTALLWFSFLGTMLVFYLLLNWLPSLMIARGMTRPDASLVQLVFNLAGAMGVLFAGAFLDGGHRLRAAVLAYAGSATAILLLALTTPHLAIALLVGSVVGGATMATQGVLYATAPPLYPAAVRGTGVGAAVAIGRLGSVAGPLLAGALFGRGHGAADVLLTVLPVIAMAGLAGCFLVSLRQEDR